MPRFEYKVVPAPQKGLKAKGVKGAEARFSHALQEVMNGLAESGWEYQRAETLPSIERSGLTSTTTEWRNVLVFRRQREDDVEAFAPELLPPPETALAAPEPAAVEPNRADAEQKEDAAQNAIKTQNDEAKSDDDGVETPFDNGVEDTTDVAGIGSTLETLAAARKSTKTDT
ncbi:MAG: DUF4177 domain-containing protein [Sulfitobacter sp.]